MLRRAAFLVLILLIAIVVFTFVAQNTGFVTIDLAFTFRSHIPIRSMNVTFARAALACIQS